MGSLNARQLRGVSRIPCSSCSALPRLDALSLAIASLPQLILKSHVPDDPPQARGSSPGDGIQVIEGQRRVAGFLEVLVGQDGEIFFCKRASVLRHDGDGLGDCVVGAFQSLDFGFQLLVASTALMAFFMFSVSMPFSFQSFAGYPLDVRTSIRGAQPITVELFQRRSLRVRHGIAFSRHRSY